MTDITPLTTDELADFRADIGDEGTPPAFSDTAIQRLYVRTEGHFKKAELLAFDQLLSSATLFRDYTQNETQDRKSQVFDHLLKRRDLLKKEIDEDVTTTAKKPQVKIVAFKEVPPLKIDKPEGW